MKSALSGFRARIAQGMPYLAWVSFVFAMVGGSLLPGTVVGQHISGFIQTFAWPWVPPVAFCAMVVGIGLDIIRDLIPDRIAVYSAMMAPTFAGAIHGKLADKVVELSQWMASWMTGPLTEWSGINTAIGVAMLALVLAFVIAKRVTKDKKSMKAATA